MHIRLVTLLPACSIAASIPSPVAAQWADLVLVPGKVVTVHSQRPRAEAVAVRGDRLIAVGTSKAIRRLAGPGTRVIDLQGRLLAPDFVAWRGRFLSLGESTLALDHRDATSWDDIVSHVSAAVRRARPGEWIVERGWQQERWRRPPVPALRGVPIHASLDSVSPNNPVFLSHPSLHGSFVNARALALAGVTRETRDPYGGEVVRDETAAPTGFLIRSGPASRGCLESALEAGVAAPRVVGTGPGMVHRWASCVGRQARGPPGQDGGERADAPSCLFPSGPAGTSGPR